MTTGDMLTLMMTHDFDVNADLYVVYPATNAMGAGGAYGPFPTRDAAVKWAEQRGYACCVSRLMHPDMVRA